MSKHTPGPWEYSADWSEYGSIHTYFSLDAGDTNIISGCGCCGSPTISSEADARLIAAAPDLLEAASEVMRLLEYHGPAIVAHIMDTDDNAGHRLRAAIAKAKGGSHED